jgi:hypothetical protein
VQQRAINAEGVSWQRLLTLEKIRDICRESNCFTAERVLDELAHLDLRLARRQPGER